MLPPANDGTSSAENDVPLPPGNEGADDPLAGMISDLFGIKEEPKEIFTYRPKYIDGAGLRDVIQEILTSGTVSYLEETNTLIVHDTKDQIEKIKTLCAMVDQHTPEILVEAQIIEFRLDNDFEKEMDLLLKNHTSEGSFVRDIFGLLPVGTTDDGMGITVRPWARGRSGGDPYNFLRMTIRALETRRKVNILSAPSLKLRRGKEGVISSGEDFPIVTQSGSGDNITYRTDFKRIGITLKVTPTRIDGDSVRLSISPSVSNQSGEVRSGDLVNPLVAIREAQTELTVKDGEIISIGGLLREEESNIVKKVPLFGSIPIIGAAFRSSNKSTTKTQLIILLHIRILEEGIPCDVNIFPPSVPDPVRYFMGEMDAHFQPTQSRFRSDVELFANEDK